MKKKIWLVGRSGRLGSALANRIQQNLHRYQLIATDVGDVDILNFKEVDRFVDQNRPDIIVNCAAKSDMVWCEENPEDAYALHAIGGRNLAIAAEHIGAWIFYLSSDFVYEGNHAEPYTEFDLPNANTVLGKSKRAGEMFVRTHCAKHTIFRSSWLYGKRMLKDMIKEAQETGQVDTGSVRIGSPTSSLAVAETILQFFDWQEYGTFHISCEGECTRQEFVQEVLRIAGVDADVVTSTSQGPYDGLRPKYSVLDNLMLRITGHPPVPHWKEALERFMEERQIRGA